MKRKVSVPKIMYRFAINNNYNSYHAKYSNYEKISNFIFIIVLRVCV